MSETNQEFSASLVAEDGSQIVLDGEQTVGRSEDCDITIDNSKVSRKHAIMRVVEHDVTLEDLGSANGTMLNGQRLEGTAALKDGDSLYFEKTAYTVAITIPGQPEAPADSDATVVNMAPVEADSDVTVVNMAPIPAAAPAPAPPVPAPVAPAADLPGSWVDGGSGGDHTQVLGMEAAPSAAAPAESDDVGRMSELPHLIVLGANGAAEDAMELEPGGDDTDVWEIGREPSCEVQLHEPSVSGRHAQLVHQDGRWRLVNLVSANGIYVNGEKRLSAFISDGDEIRLGHATLVFRGALGSASGPASEAKTVTNGDSVAPAKSGSKTLMIAVVIAVVVIAAAAGLFFLK